MAATQYVAYALSGSSFSSSLSMGGGETGTTPGAIDTLHGAEAHILGAGTNTFDYDGKVYTYEGTATIGTYNGFVAELDGKFYFFTVKGEFSPPSHTVGIRNVQYPNFGDANPATNGEWNVRTGRDGCFVAGTMIATPTGEVAVDQLRAGDEVLAADGRTVRVRWLGRSVKSRVFSDPAAILPVRIRAGALGEGLPARDLSVSPGHAILMNGVLVNAGALVNGATVVRDEDTPIVFTYFHVEVAAHELLLANGVPAESFLEAIGEMSMDNWNERAELPGEPAKAELDIPRIKSPRQLPAEIRARLSDRARVLAPSAVAA